jgi:hypothetical protein
MNVDDDSLMGKLEEIKNIKIDDKKDSDLDIKYQGSVIPIKNDKLKADYQKFQDISTKIDNEKEVTRKINIFSDAFNILDEMVKVIKKEKTDDPSNFRNNFRLCENCG